MFYLEDGGILCADFNILNVFCFSCFVFRNELKTIQLIACFLGKPFSFKYKTWDILRGGYKNSVSAQSRNAVFCFSRMMKK